LHHLKTGIRLNSLFILFFIFIPSHLFADTLAGMIVGKYANIRTIPSVVNSRIITKAYHGTAVKILDKTEKKTQIGKIEGYWFKVELIEEGNQGWVFDKYVAFEGDPNIPLYIHKVISSFYYYRADLDDTLALIKKILSKPNAFNQLKKYNPRFLNYLGYRLMAEKNSLAFPLLIAFMDPSHQKENEQDANYIFTWELLERLTPRVLITNNYKSFRRWWQRNWGTIRIDIPAYEMATLFRKIQENENRAYRKLSMESSEAP